jgi:formate C-acetyltransferase
MWWTRLGKRFDSPFLSSLVLAPDSAAEARIQRIRARLSAVGRPRLSPERARLFTAGWREAAGEPPAVRKARAAARVLEGLPVFLIEEQLFAGSPAAFPNALELEPEYAAGWLAAPVPGLEASQLRHLRQRAFMPVDVSDADLAELEQDILPYWRTRHLGAGILADLDAHAPEALEFMRRSRVFLPNFGKGLSHSVADYRSVVERGLAALAEDVRGLEARLLAGPLRPGDIGRLHCCRAMRICAEAVMRYAERCAEACGRAAAEASGPRAAELAEMARICRKVPRGPAGSWHEALQSIHFAHTAIALVDGGVSHSFGRMDSYLLPHFRAWVGEGPGQTSPAEAQELLEAFFLKCYEYQTVRDARSAKGLAGDRTNDKITLAGVNAGGRDASSELTLRFLEAQAHVHLKEPNISLRVARCTPEPVLRAALEVVRLGSGLPHLLGDESIIAALMRETGLSAADARLSADIGCQENSADPNLSPGADANGHNNAGFFNLPRVVELVLRRGGDRDGGQPGLRTPAPEDIRTPEALRAAMAAQLRHCLTHYARVNAFVEHHYGRSIPNPCLSLLHPGPRSSGVDYAAGGCRYNWVAAVGVGLATAADSLMVIEELALRGGPAAWAELLRALDDDWTGHEALRERVLALPRYGGGGKTAEAWAKWLAATFCQLCSEQAIPRGERLVRFNAGFFSMGIHLALGRDVGATPDGRHAGDALSGSASPSRFAARLGPTATHSAAAALETSRMPNGVILNEVLPLTLVRSEVDLAKWACLARTYFEQGGISVQYSVLHAEELRQAKARPQDYTDLIVRVGGYCARFIDLAPEIQDEFILRCG